MLGIGVIPPLSLFYMRYKLQEPEAYKRNTMANCKTPWKLIIKKYWFRLVVVSTIWFIYDYSSYAFGTYSAPSVDNVLGPDAPMWKTFGGNTVINLFYIPGAFIGSYVSDWIGPRKALAYGVTAQAVVGFIMAGCYEKLAIPKNIGGFVVVYGIFLSLGERKSSILSLQIIINMLIVLQWVLATTSVLSHPRLLPPRFADATTPLLQPLARSVHSSATTFTPSL